MNSLKTELRICECCGSDNLELMWSSKSIVVRRLYTWEFSENILTWVKTKTGKIFKDESLNIIGVNSSGKTLR